MTCIVGIVDRSARRVLLAGDSAAISDNRVEVRRDRKVFRKSGFVIGFCGLFRAGQVVKHQAVFPHLLPGDDAFAYMVTKFVPAIQGAFAEAAVSFEEQAFLVGVGDRLFGVGPDFAVSESASDFASIGSGCEFALGALHVLRLAPRARAQRALEAAGELCVDVRPPFHYLFTTAQPKGTP